jgi:hypothetical protein
MKKQNKNINNAAEIDKSSSLDESENIAREDAPNLDGDGKELLKDFPLNEKQKEDIRKVLQGDFDIALINLKDDIKKDSQEIKKDFLTIFGLFASFVTFLSIEVQVFKNRDNVFELIGITSISLSFVIFFALVINDIAKDKSELKDFLKPTYIINIFFLIIGVIFLYIGGISSIYRIDTVEHKIKLDSTLINLQSVEIQNLKRKIQNVDSLNRRKGL